MGCLQLDFRGSLGLPRYEAQPVPAYIAPFPRSCGRTGKKYFVKAEPGPAVHPSGRFRKDLIPSPPHQERVGNHPGHTVVDRSFAFGVNTWDAG
jgi:hypothetical protein